MKLIEFRSYRKYIRAQRSTVRRRGIGPFFTHQEITKICDWLIREREWKRDEVIIGICHGARNGMEADEFKKNLPSARVVGTDLFPFQGKGSVLRGKSTVLKYDFQRQKKRWVGRFDFVYSNSLDHARDPMTCIQTWLQQLKPQGYLFLQWDGDRQHVNRGDCFGAGLWELITLLNGVGEVIDLIYNRVPKKRRREARLLERRANEVVVLVVKSNDKA